MRTVVVVQARMTSSRLPGKVLADIAGRPALVQEVRRLRAMREADEVMVATTALPSDDPVEALAGREGLRCFRGDEQDVLSRYLGAARASAADVVVRVTGDCPLIDAVVVDRVVRALRDDAEGADYASNVMRRTHPRGLDAEAFFVDVLERVARMGRSPRAREHVTWFVHRERPDLFVQRSVHEEDDNSDLRWTMDTQADLAMIRRVYADLALDRSLLGWREILSWVRAHPEIAAMNAEVAQKDA